MVINYVSIYRLYVYHGLINYIDTKPKCRHLKKFSFKGRKVPLQVDFLDDDI
jgi:hypothetical protein